MGVNSNGYSSVLVKVPPGGIMGSHFRVGFCWELVLGIMSGSVQGPYPEQRGLRNLYFKGISWRVQNLAYVFALQDGSIL